MNLRLKPPITCQRLVVGLLFGVMMVHSGAYAATVAAVAQFTSNHEVRVECVGQKTVVRLHHSESLSTHHHAVEESMVLMLAGTDSDGDHVVASECSVSKVETKLAFLVLAVPMSADLPPWEVDFIIGVWNSIRNETANGEWQEGDGAAVGVSRSQHAWLTAKGRVQLLI